MSGLLSEDVAGTEQAVEAPVTARGNGSVAGRPRWVRTSLAEAVMVHGGRRCLLPGMSIRLRRPQRELVEGSRIVASGTWLSYERSSRARPLSAYGVPYVSLVVVTPPTEATAGSGPGGRLKSIFHSRATDRLERLLPPDVAPFAKALTLAERRDIDPAVTRRFAEAGLVHLLAISGLHIGFLAAVCVWLLGLFTRRRWRYSVAAGLIAGYVILIGSPPSAVRAALLFAGYALARARQAPASTGDLAGLAAAIAILVSPLVLVEPGFQLSYAGFAGLIGGRHAARRLTAVWPALTGVTGARAILTTLAAGAGAFVCTAPIAAAHFQRVAPVSVLSTPAAAPLVALALLGLLGALLLPEMIASLAADGAAVALQILEWVVDRFARLPLHGSASPPGPVEWAGLALVLAGLALLVLGRRPVRAVIPLAAALSLTFLAPWASGLSARAGTLLCSLDVGQGDATVVRTRAGRWIVLDAGPGAGFHASTAAPRAASRAAYAYETDWRYGDAGRRTVLPFLRSRGARAVDLFVLSHPHLDHLGGAAALFAKLPVRRVLDAGYAQASRPYLGFLQRVEAEGVQWLPGRSGARISMDEVEILVLGPEAASPGSADADERDSAIPATHAEDANDTSLIVRLTIADRLVYLNTGDAPRSAEDALLGSWPAEMLRAHVLKLGHHGSHTSTSLGWLEAVGPEIAVISAGRGNSYGHPHPVTLARLDSAAVNRVWRTDRDGDLCIIVPDAGPWRIESP